ncbi:MAG: hypothetical protein M3O30_19210 [Planctomycetota bacterium]|nr:hypothetical protein [Planctomycetota bacterium]
MPPSSDTDQQEVLIRVAADTGVYPIEAYQFLERGLGYTVAKVHGAAPVEGQDRHVSGQELCHGLREYALHQWGLLAQTVLRCWNITSTYDFGRIVFILAEHKIMRTSATDSIDDFRNVFNFKTEFVSSYRITSKL